MHHEAQGENTDNQAQSEAAAAWQEAWEQEMEDYHEYLGIFDTKYLKCTAMMALYLIHYFNLVDYHRIGNLTMSACDAYGMQSLAIATSTTIMYCPEEMSQLSDEELKANASGFIDSTRDYYEWSPGDTEHHEFYSLLMGIKDKFYQGVEAQDAGDLSVYEDSPEEWVHVMKYMIEFFSPGYIIPQTLKIAREMEAMGCKG